MIPLHPGWTAPPVGRRFTDDMTWSDFWTWLHREAGHALAFGWLPALYVVGHEGPLLTWTWIAAGILFALRAVIVGIEPTIVGVRAFLDLIWGDR